MARRLLLQSRFSINRLQPNLCSLRCSSVIRKSFHQQSFSSNNINIPNRLFSSNTDTNATIKKQRKIKPTVNEVKEETSVKEKAPSDSKLFYLLDAIGEALGYIEEAMWVFGLLGLVAAYFIVKAILKELDKWIGEGTILGSIFRFISMVYGWITWIFNRNTDDAKSTANLINEFAKITIRYWQELCLSLASKNQEVIDAFGDDICIIQHSMEDPKWLKKIENMASDDYTIQSEFQITNQDQTKYGAIEFVIQLNDTDLTHGNLKIITHIHRQYLWDKQIIVYDQEFQKCYLVKDEDLKSITDYSCF